METKLINIQNIVPNEGQIPGLPTNPRQWKKKEMEQLKKSIQETPELFGARGILVVPKDGKFVVLGGNMRLAASKSLGLDEVPCIIFPEDTPVEKLKEIVIKDNGAFGEWDYDLLANEWDDLPLVDWGVPAWETEIPSIAPEDTTEDEIERKEKEFKEKMEAGEISEEDPEYLDFLEKFKLKKTTDDCYTPDKVYNAVADWVANEYGLDKANFVRPFYPGGDYENEKYKDTDIVVDNPPFSIMAEIIRFYIEKGIRFFLFAPHLTLFSASGVAVTSLPCGVAVTYANGAVVNTSFQTNLEDKNIRSRSVPTLYKVVKEANDAVIKEQKKELPKYQYDHHIVTSTFLGQLSRLGIDLVIPADESMAISQLDSQKESGKAIFGKGLLISENVFAEREKAEREKAEREKAERWELSEREQQIVFKLTKKK